MTCPACGAENPEGKRFCGDCGGPLAGGSIPAGLEGEVAKLLSARLKDAKVVEIETSQAIVSRLTDWAKLFGIVVGIPLALLAIVLGVLGIHTYNDFSSQVSTARVEALQQLEQRSKAAVATLDKKEKEADRTLAGTKQDADRIARAYKDLGIQLEQTRALASQYQELSSKVDQLERAVVKFQPSAALTPTLKRNLDQALRRYHSYLKSAGLSVVQPPPTVLVEPTSDNLDSYYDPQKNQIVISVELAPYAGSPLREYTHHVLLGLKPQFPATDDPSGLESGLADYFPASFTQRSDVLQEVLKVFAKRYPGTAIPSRDLDNHRSFQASGSDPALPQDAGNVWAGAFWELRQTMGRELADRLLLAAWQHLDAVGFSRDIKAFPREISSQDSALESGRHLDQIRQIFQRRGLVL